MWTQAKIKFRQLLFDDSGIAMAYTIVTFLVFFMICISTFAMSENIRRKMELQNACDAAAYSAAVVQADMLSRIAVLNRALSWTYAETNKRQMDYIVDKWASAIYNSYIFHKNNVEILGKLQMCVSSANALYNGGKCEESVYFWYAGTQDDNAGHITLNSTDYLAEDTITEKGITEKGISSLIGKAYPSEKNNIQTGKHNIAIINQQILWIKQNINTAIGSAISKAMSAQSVTQYEYYTDEAWQKSGSASYIVREHDEETLLNYSGNTISGCYQKGYNSWWQANIAKNNDDEDNSDGDDYGIRRLYKQVTGGALIAKIKAKSYSHKDTLVGCGHAQTYDSSWVDNVDYETEETRDGVTYTYKHTILGTDISSHKETLKGEDVADEYFTGAFARPQKLSPDFFGRRGTIIVAAQLGLTNPLTVLFGTVGIYNQNLYFGRQLLAISAARAGIRLKPSIYDGEYSIFYPRDTRTDMAYCNGVWNLCEEDWDAVMLPINRAWCSAPSGTQFSQYDPENHVEYSSNAILSKIYTRFNRSGCPENVDNVMWH